MSTIDDRIKEILRKLVLEEYLGDIGEEREQALAAIKAVFESEGYVQLPNATMTKEGWIEVSSDKGVRAGGVPLMTGQQWLERFEQELDKEYNPTKGSYIDKYRCLYAARIASGIEGKQK